MATNRPTAIITGASSGIGRGIAISMAKVAAFVAFTCGTIATALGWNEDDNGITVGELDVHNR